jgi:quinoprotein glucose dehydrogenase
VDLKLNDDQTMQPDLTTGEIGLQSAPVVAGNTIIIGAAFREGMTPRSMRNNKGYVRGRELAGWLGGVHRQHRRLDADHGR